MTDTASTRDERESAAIFSPDARWLYLGRGEGGRLFAEGAQSVFIIWWRRDENGTIQPPADWQHDEPLTVPDGLDPFRGTAVEETPRFLAVLMLLGVPIHDRTSYARLPGHPDHDQIHQAPDGELLMALERAVDIEGPQLIERYEGSTESKLAKLRDALALFRTTGCTAPIGGDGLPRRGERPDGDHLMVPAAGIWADVQNALALGRFGEVGDTRFPRAAITKGKSRGYAELRPITPLEEQALPPEEIDALTQRMWRQREELSDLDADTMDAIAAIWIRANPDRASDRVPIYIDDLLRMRGLKPKKGGTGRRGGFEPEQRAALWQCLLHLQNVWLDISEVTLSETTKQGKRKQVRRAFQSRAFVISDRTGQRRIDGSLDIDGVLVAPGEIFGRFLLGPGRQVALLSAAALRYDPLRQRVEKRLARFFAWQWRIGAKDAAFTRRYRVATLLEQTGVPDDAKPSRIRERLEGALDRLAGDGVVAGWQYDDGWRDEDLPRKGWLTQWKEVVVLVEAPDVIKNAYQSLDQGTPPPPALASAPWSERVRQRRVTLGGISQAVAAEQIGISRPYLAQIERGRKPSKRVAGLLETWLS